MSSVPNALTTSLAYFTVTLLFIVVDATYAEPFKVNLTCGFFGSAVASTDVSKLLVTVHCGLYIGFIVPLVQLIVVADELLNFNAVSLE